jgi:hypothetical protein
MEINASNGSPSSDDELSPVERYLLEQKGYTTEEIELIERSITSGCMIEDHPRLSAERACSRHKSSKAPVRDWDPESAMEEPDGEIGTEAFFEAEDALPGLEDVWKSAGVAGVIREHPPFFVSVEDTYYTFRDWKQIQQAFFEAELTPLPGQTEIESACGPSGLGLPSATIDGTLYFDFEFVEASDEAKARRASEHAQAREEVLRYLVGKRLERWEE